MSSKYDADAYEIHKKHIEELLKEAEEWAEFVSSSVKYDFTRFSLYYNGTSADRDVVMSLRGSRVTIAEAISRLKNIHEAIGELEKEFKDEVNYAD